MSQFQLISQLNDEIIITILDILDFQSIGRFMVASKSTSATGYMYFEHLWQYRCGWNHMPFNTLCLENFKKKWHPTMTIMPLNYIWLVIGLSTCTHCKLIDFNLALDNYFNICNDSNINLQKTLMMCNKCTLNRTCEDCTTVHEDIKNIEVVDACADSYSCCTKKQCYRERCIWKCNDCNLILNPVDENCKAITIYFGNVAKKRIVCTQCYSTSYQDYELVDNILWYGLSIEDYERRYG